jgi:precorrin-3B C17-methyltransferase
VRKMESYVQKKIKIAINGGIGFGAKLTAKQLLVLAEYLAEGDELELTTFQQLYIEIPEDNKDVIIEKFEETGLRCYPVGNFVKSFRTCNFCQGAEEEGMPVAIELNRRLAGRPVPFTLKPAYTGCPVGCGEPMINDIGVMKVKDHYQLYLGGKSKGQDAKAGKLVFDNLSPSELYVYADKIIQIYNEQGKKREPFYKFLDRIGLDALREQVISKN